MTVGCFYEERLKRGRVLCVPQGPRNKEVTTPTGTEIACKFPCFAELQNVEGLR